MEGAYTFTCQLCRARLTLVGNVEAAESVAWAGGRGLLVPPHLQASVFDHTNVDESFIVLDGKRQGLPGGAGGPLPHNFAGLSQHYPLPAQNPHQHQQHQPTSLSAPQQHQQKPGSQQQQQQSSPHQHPPSQHPQTSPLGRQQQQLLPPHAPRGLEDSFVVLGAASVLRPSPGLYPPHLTQTQTHLPYGVNPLQLQALQQQQQQQQVLQHQQQQQPPRQQQQQLLSGQGRDLVTAPSSTQQQLQQQADGGGGSHVLPVQSTSPHAQPQLHQTLPSTPQLPHQIQPPQPSLSSSPQLQQHQLAMGGPRRALTAAGGGAGGGPACCTDAETLYGGPGGGTDVCGVERNSANGGASVGSGLDAKLQALAHLFELASTNTQVDHPLCMDCVGQLKEEMEAQIAEAEREIAAYSACFAQMQLHGDTDASTSAGNHGSVQSEPGRGPVLRDAEEYQLEEISRLEQELVQERARAEVLEAELAAVISELSSLSAASADLTSLEERYWHDVSDFDLLLRTHTDERGALLARIDRARQRLQLLKNTSVLYDAFKIWHDGPFGTISGFRLGRTPEVQVEWDEINAAWGQAVLLLHTMALMCKVQFSQHRLLPMGSHPRVADKKATYDLFGPVSKLWSANYDRAMVGYLACLREFGEHARRKEEAEGKLLPFSFPFPIDSDKVSNQTIKLTLNKDVRWTKALKFMLANLKIALQWCVKQDQNIDIPHLQQLQQEGPQLTSER